MRITRYQIILSCILLFPFTWLACFDVPHSSEPVAEDELIGTYVPSYYGDFTEKIILDTGDIYIHYYFKCWMIEYFDTNKWYLRDGNTDQPRIVLKGFIDRYPICIGHRYRGPHEILDTLPYDWSPYILKHNYEILIEREPSSNQYYRKLDSVDYNFLNRRMPSVMPDSSNTS